MFTGIVEELGKVQSLSRGARSARMVLEARVVLEDVKLGDSIAVNGVCLTVTEFSSNRFGVDIMAETLDRSNLGRLTPGDLVNLERALRLSDRLGGHLVSGHIDGVGAIVRESREDLARILDISAPPGVTRYIIEKGSITVDGTSLTVVSVRDDGFTVSLIPHTRGQTTLGFKKVGHTVNLEADLIGKYVEKLLGLTGKTDKEAGPRSGLTIDFLAQNGFL
ncbi:MAG: riboflavin synthase [Firmicutes bacterium]|nr:riboflavin synthase [Bacillota bacterium]